MSAGTTPEMGGKLEVGPPLVDGVEEAATGAHFADPATHVGVDMAEDLPPEAVEPPIDDPVNRVGGPLSGGQGEQGEQLPLPGLEKPVALPLDTAAGIEAPKPNPPLNAKQTAKIFNDTLDRLVSEAFGQNVFPDHTGVAEKVVSQLRSVWVTMARLVPNVDEKIFVSLVAMGLLVRKHVEAIDQELATLKLKQDELIRESKKQ